MNATDATAVNKRYMYKQHRGLRSATAGRQKRSTEVPKAADRAARVGPGGGVR
jgi:hypothetical protein